MSSILVFYFRIGGVNAFMNNMQAIDGTDGFHYQFEFKIETDEILGVPFRTVSCNMYVDQHFAIQFFVDEIFLTIDSIEIRKGKRVIRLPLECIFLFDEMALEG